MMDTYDTARTMAAIEAAAPGGPEVLRVGHSPVPRPVDGEVLIRVAAAGVNRPDIAQRQGLYPPPPGATPILGLEVAGTVSAVGDGVDGAIIGRRVCALLPGGGYAEYVAAYADHCLPVPDGLSMAEAAAMPETLFTVWSNVFQQGSVREGDTILVHGGTSGIGTMAIALGQLVGVDVIVTAGSQRKCDAARALGAKLALDYGQEDFVPAVRAAAPDGVRAVLDMVGGDYVRRNLDCLADEGKHISIAMQRGPEATLPLWAVMSRRLVLTGSTLRARDRGFKALLTADIVEKVWPHVVSGRFRPVIDRVFALADVAAAHRRMEAGNHVGKIVLQVDQKT